MDSFQQLGARWIWLPQETATVNQYVEFRHEFTLDGTVDLTQGECALHISVDTEYAAWLNGEPIGFNQYDDYPWHKAYDALDVRKHLRKGANTLCVLAYHQGRNSFQYIKGTPGLIWALKAGSRQIASNAGVKCRLSPAYRNGEMETVSPQLQFAFQYDARPDDGWRTAEYDDTAWLNANIMASMAEVELYPRPNKKLVLGEPAPGRVTAQGFFRRESTLQDGGATTAARMQRDYLSARREPEVFGGSGGEDIRLPCSGLAIAPPPAGNDGMYLLVDLAREEAGLFHLDIDAGEGAMLDISYGEQLDDLRVRAAVGGRNFAFSYTCREGRQQFTHWFKRIAGRYLELHIHGMGRGVTLYYAGMRPVEYPLEPRGSFRCGDRLFNRIHDVSARTLHLCMHEHYEDTPWREQALYAMDSRNQALCGYYCFGEYDFPEAAFSLCAENIGGDGFMEICSPARDRITIPVFSMAWILAVRDLVLFSGRLETARRLLPCVQRLLDGFISCMTGGLMRTPEGDRYWNFYEWADGLDDTMIFSNPSGRERGRLDAPLNLFLCLALEAGAQLARWTGDGDAARYSALLNQARQAFHRTFWDESRMAYKTYAGGSGHAHFAELTQALALCAGAVSQAAAPTVRARLAAKDNGMVRTTLSYAIYKYEALLQEPDAYAAAVFDDIAADWGHMLYNGATSFWETIKGADDFDKAGSLCHGWSAIPVYFFYAYLLGVKPTEPGFARYSMNPIKGIVDRVTGTVPTPGGCIEIS